MAGRILVLDDEENYAEMLKDLLCGHNYQVDMATRPERAIDQLQEMPYDLVISDYKMPVMDGADFLKKARELYPNLPFILVSGLMNTPELVKVANMSVTLVLEKPLDTTAFLSHVARFAEAMTDDEQAAFSEESNGLDTPAPEKPRGYPEEPRFFSASSPESKRFMRDLWDVSEAGSHVFILEPTGGDAALAVKDLSAWRGNLDKPMQSIDFADFMTGGAGQVEELLSHHELSDVISIRLASSSQISEAKRHLEEVVQLVTDAKDSMFVYLLEGDMRKAEFLEKTGAAGCILPKLWQRPADIAQYARRFARLVADRLATPTAAEFTHEAAYAVLAFEWPGNYQQVQEVISKAVKLSNDSPLTLDALKDALAGVVVPAPSLRMESFLQHMQANQLCALLGASESVETLARRLELDGNPQTEGDLRKLPLVNPKLANL